MRGVCLCRLQVAGCLKALTALADRRPEIVLPQPKSPAVDCHPRLLADGVAAPEGVPSHPGRIQDLEIIVVRDRADRAVWNTLIAREHPHGMTTFAGCQVRYLVGSAHGWLGAGPLNRMERRAAPGASAADRLPEPFPDPSVGAMPASGEFRARPHPAPPARGQLPVRRQDREHRRAKTAKTVFMVEPERSWRRKLGVSQVDHAPSLEPGAGLNADDWAQNEFGGAPLGDKRLSARLVKSAGLLAAWPVQKINASYRMIEVPAESEISPSTILAPHRERSIQRIRDRKTVLAIQDGTDLNFSRRPGCDGLQVTGTNQTKASSLGLHLHATLAVTEAGLPLRVLKLGFDLLKPRSQAKETRRRTQRWLEGFRDVAAATREVGGKTRVISVCDWEADLFELFDAQRRSARVDLLVCARHDRVLDKGRPKLFAVMAGGASDGLIDIEIEGPTERPKASRKKARPARQKRPTRHAARDGHRPRLRAGVPARGACQADRTARGRGSRPVVPADRRAGRHCKRGGRNRRLLPSALADRGLLDVIMQMLPSISKLAELV